MNNGKTHYLRVSPKGTIDLADKTFAVNFKRVSNSNSVTNSTAFLHNGSSMISMNSNGELIEQPAAQVPENNFALLLNPDGSFIIKNSKGCVDSTTAGLKIVDCKQAASFVMETEEEFAGKSKKAIVLKAGVHGEPVLEDPISLNLQKNLSLTDELRKSMLLPISMRLQGAKSVEKASLSKERFFVKFNNY